MILRFLSFLLFLFVGMLPVNLVGWAIDSGILPVSHDSLSIIAPVFLVFYVPLAFYFASFGSDQCRGNPEA